MSVPRTALLAAVFMTALPVAAVSAKPPLREVSEIDDTLFVIAVANEIDEYCSSIKGRRMKGLRILWDLKSRANDLGYSDAEIRAYVESDVEKARMRAKGEAYLKANGVSYDEPGTFCTLGRAEINKKSQIGVLLRAK